MPAPVHRTTPKLPPLPRPKGRPCLLSIECERALIAAIEKGMPLKESAMLAGISYDTLNRWTKRGENEDAPEEFRHLCKALNRAKAVAMLRHVSVIDRAGERGDWRASAWILERRHPEKFGRITSEETGKSQRSDHLPTPIEHEVLARIKKQNGIFDIATLVAQKLQRIREEKAAKEAEATNSKTNFRGDD